MSTVDETVKKLYGELTAQVKPNAQFNAVKSDLDRVEPEFIKLYDGKPVDGSKLEEGFNAAAKSYITALYSVSGSKQPIVDGPEWYGNEIRSWLRQVSDEALGQVKAAIKAGNRAEVLRLFNQAYQAQANKLTSVLSKVQEQPSEVQLGVWGQVAKALGGKNAARVATNPGAALQALGQLYAIQEAYN